VNTPLDERAINIQGGANKEHGPSKKRDLVVPNRGNLICATGKFDWADEISREGCESFFSQCSSISGIQIFSKI
jgi:hypothetical protein